MEHLDKSKIQAAKHIDGQFKLEITPFSYLDGSKPRLPRKSSKGYYLREDTKYYFNYAFKDIATEANSNKFSVEIIVRTGEDSLGLADLDNYCKAILDGITSTKKVWLDDKQVDSISIRRYYSKEPISSILLSIHKS